MELWVYDWLIEGSGQTDGTIEFGVEGADGGRIGRTPFLRSIQTESFSSINLHSPYEDKNLSGQIDLSCVYNIDRNRRKKERPNG